MQEAPPVQVLIDDGLKKLRLLALVNEQALEEAENLEEKVGPDVAEALFHHRSALKDVNSNAKVAELTALRLARILKTSGASDKLVEYKKAHDAPDANNDSNTSMFEFIKAFDDAGAFAFRKLGTTLEEETGRKAQFDLAVDRERKAAKELQTLERQLAGERAARAAIMGELTSVEARAVRDLALARAAYDALQAGMHESAAAAEAAAGEAFTAEGTALRAEVARLKAELEAAVKLHREEEMALRKKRIKSEQEVGNWVAEYDKDMESREAVLVEERAAHKELAAKLRATEERVAELKHDRAVHDFQERERRKAHFNAKMKAKIEERSARLIQSAWKTHEASKPARADTAASGGKKGKK